MNERQIKYMVDRFLGWPLPNNFTPDGGITFERYGNKGTPQHQYENRPTGTNLLDAQQAEAMVRHMLDGKACERTTMQAELAAKDARIAALEETAGGWNACNIILERDNEALRKELAEALQCASVEAGLRREAKAALESTNARIAALEAAGSRLGDAAIDGILTGMENVSEERAENEALRKELAEVKAALATKSDEALMNKCAVHALEKLSERAHKAWTETLEVANARIAEFADKGTLQALRDANNRTERAEAECKVMREALEPFAKLNVGRFMTDGIRYEFRVDAAWIRKARAALNPPPAKLDTKAASVELKAAENEESRNHIEASRPPPPPGWRQW